MNTITNSDLAFVLNALSRPHMVLDLAFRIVSINNSGLTMLGRNRTEVIGKNLSAISDPTLNREIFLALENTAQDGIRREVVNKSGDFRLITSNIVTRVGDLLIVETEDITKIYEFSARERLEHAKNKALAENINQAIITIDFQEQTLTPNRASLEIFGDFSALKPIFFAPLFDLSLYDYETDLNFNFPGAKPFKDLIATIKEVWLSGTPKDELLQKGTESGTKLIHRRVNRWEVDGISRGIIITGIDVTDLLKLKEEVAESKYKIEQILQNLNIWLFVYDEKTGAGEYLTASGADKTQENYLESLSPELRTQIREAIDLLYLNGVHTFDVYDAVNSRTVRTSLSFLELNQPGSRKILAINRDITQELELEKNQINGVQSNQVQQFAQGVAHDFGNIAQSFDGYSKLLRTEVDSERAQVMLQQLTSSATRALKITNRISEIARIQTLKNEKLNLRHLFSGCIEDLRALVDHNINLSFEIDESTDGLALGNEMQLQRIIENILENANRAMCGTGEIRIRVSEANENDEKIEIVNDGPAIPKQIADQIFAPFVSTRKDVGAGLGLYLAAQYLNSFGGSIELKNHNRHVSFNIYLPRSGGDSK